MEDSAVVDFLIVGAQKCGTTSLHRYLSQHKQIFMPERKEVDFFGSDESYDRGIEYYSSFFTSAAGWQKLGEASPQYMYSLGTAQRIAAHNPECRLIMLLREPFERAVSHYKMNLRRGTEKRQFDEVITDFLLCDQSSRVKPPFDYFGLSQYGRFVTDYLRYFDRDAILVEFAEDLSADRLAVVQRTEIHIGVENEIGPADVDQKYHVTGEERLPGLYRAKQGLTALPPPIRRFLGASARRFEIDKYLHRLETEWNVSEKQIGVSFDQTLRSEVIDKLGDDYELLLAAGVEDRWPEYAKS